MNRKAEPKSKVDDAIDQVLSEMAGYDADTEPYARLVDQLDKLYKIKSSEKDQDRVSKDTLVAVGANLLGIALILGYERAHVVASKALSFVLKTRV